MMKNLEQLNNYEMLHIDGGWRNSGTALGHGAGIALAAISFVQGFLAGSDIF